MFDKAKEYIKNFRQTINTNLLNTMGAAAMASKAIGYVTSTMREVTAEAKKFEQQSARLGVAPEEIAKLNKLSNDAGVPFKTITKGLNQVKAAASEALIDPSSDIAQTFEKLGIDATTLAQAGKDPMMVFGQISDALNAIGDDGQQMQAIDDVFKANGLMLKGLIEMGSSGIKKNYEDAISMTPLMIAQNSAMEDAWGKFWEVLKNGFTYFAVVLNPIIQAVRIMLNGLQMCVQVVWLLVNAFKNLIGANLAIMFGSIGVSIGICVSAIGAFIKALGYLTFSDTLKEFGDDALSLGKSLTNASVQMAGDALKGQLDDLKDTYAKTGQRIGGDVRDVFTSMSAMGKGYGKTETAEEQNKRYAEEAKIAEAKKKFTDEAEKGALIGASDIVKRMQLEKELLEIKKEGWKFEKQGQKGTVEHYAYLQRQQAKLNEIHAINQAQQRENDKAREAREKAADDEEKASRQRAIQAEQEDARNRYSMNTAFESLAEKMKEQRMRESGATEGEIKLAQLDKETKKLETMQADIDKFLNGRSLEDAMKFDPANTTKIMNEFAGQLGKVQGIGIGLMGGKTSVDTADEARRRGMGGQVSTVVSSSAIPKAQLEKLTKIETNTGVLASRLLSITGGQSSLATIRESATTAEAKLAGDGAIPL